MGRTPRTKRQKPSSAQDPQEAARPHRSVECLDTEGLRRVEESFRLWVEASSTHRPARLRIFLLFLLIRHTGAKLHEVLRLNPSHDIDWNARCIFFREARQAPDASCRAVDVSRHGLEAIRAVLEELKSMGHLGEDLALDAAFVRRKFYERAEACGFPRRLGAPEMIRKARAMELLKGHLPLPVVQKVLGHAVSSGPLPYPSFSDKDMRQVMKLFVERESIGQTSARNAFYGRVETIVHGDIQAKVCLVTVEGHRVSTVITMDSLKRLAVQEGTFMVAEVKAPWVVLASGSEEPLTSLENRFRGTIRRIVQGQVTAEVTVELADGTALCAIVSAESAQRLALKEGDWAWAGFSAHAVVLHGHGAQPSLWSLI